ncbi:MAG TPA: ferrous iron transport protein B [Pyrinomonadaceae bacterium]|nr:ferrous iron transport protein B [Pyrinomonadaceae bacterium]
MFACATITLRFVELKQKPSAFKSPPFSPTIPMSALPTQTFALAESRLPNLQRRSIFVALAGNPNAGKTTLFNALTGLRQKVANYPGVTVESKSGVWKISPNQPAVSLVDLPGLYSLDATSIDEQIASDILTGQNSSQPEPDVILVAVDSTNLVRNLYLAQQLIEAGKPVVIALTMFDMAERILKIDVESLSGLLGAPVVAVVPRERQGLEELGRTVLSVASTRKPKRSPPIKLNRSQEENLLRRYEWIDAVVSETVQPLYASTQRNISERIDRVLTHKIFGPLVLLVILLLVFQAIFSWANIPMQAIDGVFASLSALARAHLPAGVFTDLLTDGVIAGVGGVLVFIPQILMLFVFITILEDTGYMARAAFLTDRVMRTFGLHGKAFMPLLSSFACAVPGVMATRTIENPKDRLATIMIAPFMSCSARLPVYSLMIAAFFTEQKVLGILSVGVVIILGMYLLGIAVAIIIATLLKHTILKGPTPPFVLELPSYRIPNLRNIVYTLLNRIGLFIKRAGTVILAISILLWALAAFPRTTDQQSAAQQIEYSFAGRTGRLIEPVIAPLGFDWRIGIGLISSFAARETIISTLSIVYSVGATPGEDQTLTSALHGARRADGSPVWTPLVALSLMVFFALACQCMSTLAVVRRETNSWRWPLFMICYMFVLAYVASFVTYQGGRLMGFS